MVIPERVYFHPESLIFILNVDEIQYYFLWSTAIFVVECFDIYFFEHSMAWYFEIIASV
jgi:hypothetical protein